MKDILQLTWDDETQKYFVSRIGTFIDYNGNEFIGTEYFFPTDKTIEEILEFLDLNKLKHFKSMKPLIMSKDKIYSINN